MLAWRQQLHVPGLEHDEHRPLRPKRLERALGKQPCSDICVQLGSLCKLRSSWHSVEHGNNTQDSGLHLRTGSPGSSFDHVSQLDHSKDEAVT